MTTNIFDSKERLFHGEVDSLFLGAFVMLEEMYQNTDARLHQYYNGYAIVVINAINEHLFEEIHRLFLESMQDELSSVNNLPHLNLRKIMDILFRYPDNCIKINHKGGMVGFSNISKEIHGVDVKKNPIIKINETGDIAKLKLLIEGSKQGNPPYSGFHLLRNSIAHNSNILDYSGIGKGFFFLKKNIFKNGNMSDIDFLEKSINLLKAGYKELSSAYFKECSNLYL